MMNIQKFHMIGSVNLCLEEKETVFFNLITFQLLSSLKVPVQTILLMIKSLVKFKVIQFTRHIGNFQKFKVELSNLVVGL